MRCYLLRQQGHGFFGLPAIKFTVSKSKRARVKYTCTRPLINALKGTKRSRDVQVSTETPGITKCSNFTPRCPKRGAEERLSPPTDPRSQKGILGDGIFPNIPSLLSHFMFFSIF